MTEYQVSLTGLHARNEKTIQTTQDWERSRINEVTLRESFDKDCESLVELQRHVGAEYVTDGQITLAWQDLSGRSAGIRGARAWADGQVVQHQHFLLYAHSQGAHLERR